MSNEATPEAASSDATGEGAGAHRARRPGATSASVLLVRHAESEANAGGYYGGQSDSGLSARGLRQVRALTEALRGLRIDAVYSSDLRRARETVAPLAAERGLEVRETEALRERSMGVLTGVPFERVKLEHAALWARLRARDHHARPEGGESHADLAARVHALLEALRARHAGQTVLLGSHGGTIHHLLRALLRVPQPEHTFFFAVDNASVSRVDLLHEGGVEVPRLTYVNRVPANLEGDAGF